MQISNSEPASNQKVTNQKQIKIQESLPLNYSIVRSILLDLTPLTLPFRDLKGRIIQLWKTVQHGLIGGVVNSNGQISIIPANKIINSLNPNENSNELIHRLQSYPPKKWDLVFNTHLCTLTIWPHLKAEGRRYFGKNYQEIKQDVEKRLNNMQTEAALNRRHYHAAQREAKGHVIKINSRDNEPFDHGNDVRESQKAAKKLIKDIKDRLKKPDLNDNERKNLEKVIADTSRLIKESKTYTPLLHKQNPAGKQFQENVQKEGLSKSFNASHPDNPIGKGGNKEIGGVGGTVELIEGLFDTPESILETEHSFFIPQFEGETLFTSQEMSQLIQELAMGIYVHATVPFFSLHFNHNADLYPIVHPAYENTLVGQVFGMLDYYMKGYLNGGVFNESFVQEWQKNPSKFKVDEKILPELINFRSYAEQNLSGADQEYLSVRELLKMMEIKDLKNDSLEKTGFNFYDYTKFSNSFRIIAKQKSIDKTENLFSINSDFEVQYTIEANPDYKKALDEYLHLNGKYPKAYLNLNAAYEKMRKQIHSHMIKMPFCKKYFAMLGVINFFSYYFTTLKKHHKYPVLPKVNLEPAKCPALFPALPVLTNRTEEFKISKYQVLNELLKNSYKIKFFITVFTVGLATSLNKYIEQLCWENLLSNTSNDFKKDILNEEEKFRNLCKIFAEGFDLLNLIRSKYKDPNDSLEKFRESLLITISNEPTIIATLTKNLFILSERISIRAFNCHSSF